MKASWYKCPAPGTSSFIGPAPGHFLLCKSPGAGHTFRCKSPGVPGGGMVTGQIDTCITDVTVVTSAVLFPPCIMYVQYIGGCLVHRGCSVHWGDTMSTSGVFSTLGGYHEYIGGCSVHRRDTMSTSAGYQLYIGGIS